MTPTEIVQGLQADDPAAAEELCRLVTRCVSRFCSHRNWDDWDDIRQGALVAVWRNVRAGRIREADKLASYIHVSVASRWKQYWRHHYADQSIPIEPELPVIDPTSPADERFAVREALEQVFLGLNARDAGVLWLRYIYGDSIYETSAATGLHPSHIKTICFRNKPRLARLRLLLAR
jgi:DNA-directed RNA polymerase specialized sigma24 family protein